MAWASDIVPDQHPHCSITGNPNASPEYCVYAPALDLTSISLMKLPATTGGAVGPATLNCSTPMFLFTYTMFPTCALAGGASYGSSNHISISPPSSSSVTLELMVHAWITTSPCPQSPRNVTLSTPSTKRARTWTVLPIGKANSSGTRQVSCPRPTSSFVEFAES